MRESWWIVVDIGQRDVDCGGPRQTPYRAGHVFGLDDDQVHLSRFSVHVWHSSPDDTCDPGVER